jgi:hypothetical protein
MLVSFDFSCAGSVPVIAPAFIVAKNPDLLALVTLPLGAKADVFDDAF